MTIVIIVGTKGTEKLSAAKHQQTKNLSTYPKKCGQITPETLTVARSSAAAFCLRGSCVYRTGLS